MPLTSEVLWHGGTGTLASYGPMVGEEVEMSAAMKELLKAARKAAKSDDPEAAHSDLDGALYTFVAAVDPKGAEELSKIVSGMTLWYA